MAQHRKSARPKKSKLKRSRRPKRASHLKRRRHSTRNRKSRRAPIRKRIQPKRRHRRSRRRMVTFSNRQRHLVVLSRRMAGVNGRYLNAVRRLLQTNDPTALADFAGQSIKDVHGHEFPLETRANALYRANSVPEPIAEIYQVLT